MIPKGGKFFPKPEKSIEKCDSLLIISPEQKAINEEAEDKGEYKPFCSFCQRYMDRHSMIGPFVMEHPSKLKDKSVEFT